MKFTVITIFPQLVEDYFKEGIMSRALKKKQIQLKTISPRKFTKDRHQTVDDIPYGGGAGLVMKIEPLVKAIKTVTKVAPKQVRGNKITRRIILLDPRGKRFTQKEVKRLQRYDELIFICGRYEGVDERIKYYIDEKMSVGDFVLMGGELGALTVMEAVARLIPDVLHHPESAKFESFSEGSNLEHPQYTRPEVFEGHKVPKVLLSGHHGEIDRWRKTNSRQQN
ncbi:MAG: tRNA (guanosine(37)-N1)-methyltransferase TrmD [Patescibacteria group bacterium]|nr:tRNA (guanosine(37)-N1)-methyltransferase TrmD [Patescibacteria group bacterium]